MYFVCKENNKFKETAEFRNYIRSTGRPIYTIPLYEDDYTQEPFFIYGTRTDVRPWENHESYMLYNQSELYKFSWLLGNLKDELLNWNAILLPAGIANEFDEYSRLAHSAFSGDVFIRPNSGEKQFTGQVIQKEALRRGILHLGVDPHELVIISPFSKISAEYRFFIHNESIVGCRYLPDESLIIPKYVLDYANYIKFKIQDGYGHYNTFVLDIAVNREEPKILEINSYSSSGFYCIPVEQVFSPLLKGQ